MSTVWKRSRILQSKSQQVGQSIVEQYGGEDVSYSEVVGKFAASHREHGEVRRKPAGRGRICPSGSEGLSAALLEWFAGPLIAATGSGEVYREEPPHSGGYLFQVGFELLFGAARTRHELADGVAWAAILVKDGVHLFRDGHLDAVTCGETECGSRRENAFGDLAIE